MRTVSLRKSAVSRSARREAVVQLINRMANELMKDYVGLDVHLWVAITDKAIRGGLRYVYLGFWKHGLVCHWLWDSKPTPNAVKAVYRIA